MQLPSRPAGGPKGQAGPKRTNPFARGIAGARRAWSAVEGPLRPVLLVVTPLLLLVVGIVSLLSLFGGVELRSLEQHLYNTDTREITSNSTLLGQSFQVPRDGLSRVDLQLSTRPNLSLAGEIRLFEGDGMGGRVLYAAPLSDATFSNDPYLTVKFPPVSNSAGMTYTLVMSTTDRPIVEAFAVRYNSFDALSSGMAYTNEGGQRGDLVISAYYAYRPANLLGDMLATLTGNLLGMLAWVALLFLPGLALLTWLPSGLTRGQRVLAAPAVTALTLPVLLLVLRSAGLPLGAFGVWSLLILSGAALLVALYQSASTRRSTGTASQPSATPASHARLSLLPADILFWGLLATVFLLTLAVRFVSLRDVTAGLGLDAYHHTLIAGMIIDAGGLPQNYLPYAELSSFTYHFGFHSLIAGVGWVSGQTEPYDLLLLMPQVGQFTTALPVLTLTLFGWRAFNNRWAGLLAGSVAGLFCIFPAFYVNWSRYTQFFGLALLPVAWLLAENILRRSKSPHKPIGQSTQMENYAQAEPKPARRGIRYALDVSAPYILGVVAVAGLFLSHYRIAIFFSVMLALYIGGRLLSDVFSRGKGAVDPDAVPPLRMLRRAALLTFLVLAALSPWLLNLAQNFRSHLVGRDESVTRAYYSLTDMSGLLAHPTMLAMYALSVIGLMAAIKERVRPLLLMVGTWALLGLWSNPFLFDWLLPKLRLPYAGYLDATTWAQSLWLPLSLLTGYALAWIGQRLFDAAGTLSGARVRVWRGAFAASAVAGLLLLGLATSLPAAANIDKKPYLAPADREALQWMRDNLPRDSYVVANPFAFRWAPLNVYGTDSGMWIPLMAGLKSTVPPLPAYNEQLADPAYLDRILNIIRAEPLAGVDMTPQAWQDLKSSGVTHIYVGSRGGSLSIGEMLLSDAVELIFHKDGVYLFAIR